MRIVAVFLALLIVPLAALTPAADQGLIPYVDLAHKIAPWATLGVAALLFRRRPR
mgnify:FL=1